MGLSRKTMIYSTVLSVMIVTCMAGYFIWLLPSLYIDYRHRQNFETAVRLQETFRENRSFDAWDAPYPVMSAYSFEIPMQENCITIAHPAFQVRIPVTDEKLVALLDGLREGGADWERLAEEEGTMTDFNLWDRLLSDDGPLSDLIGSGQNDTGQTVFNQLLDSIEISDSFRPEAFQVSSQRYRHISEDTFGMETTVTEGTNYYTTYMIMGRDSDAVLMTLLFSVTPQMTEIRPIVLESLPMIAAVSFLLVLISSQIFSRHIVDPVLRLSRHARSIKDAGITVAAPFTVRGRDEISALGHAWNEMNRMLADQYRLLEEENKRQEVFLRASSHQLKTPVAAALLLTDSMIHEIGPYKDTRIHLPRLKEQLQLMQKMIEDILSLNQPVRPLEWETADLRDLMKECVRRNQLLLERKDLTVIWQGETMPVQTDLSCMLKLLENLLSNAIHYTKNGQNLILTFHHDSFTLLNCAAAIPDELLPHIFAPFTTDNSGQKGRGLGLYIVAYYSRLLGFDITITNRAEGVEARLSRMV